MHAISTGRLLSPAESAIKMRRDRYSEDRKVGRARRGFEEIFSSSRTERVVKEAGNERRKFAEISNARRVVDKFGNVVKRRDGNETVVPPAERKIVFNGLDALYHFHREIFLPALEIAAAPLTKAASLAETDSEGQLSTRTARAVANVFLSHAAFMKMYSTYIK